MKKTTWSLMPTWKKRLHGFGTYLFAAFVSLLYPVEAAKAMYEVLRDQFED